MMKKIRMNCTATMDETFADFLLSRRAKGLAEKTLESYSDAELTALLKKPDIRKTTFAEYRDWVIVNFLLNCGSCAATVGAIQIRDVDLDGGTATRRTEKRRSFPFAAP